MDENNLMDRLLNDFSKVLEEFNQLVKNNDVEGVKKVLAQVTKLVQERDGIPLDDREDPQYDHVLHEFLDKLEGVVEQETLIQGADGEIGRVHYTNVEIQVMIDEVKAQRQEIFTKLGETPEGPEYDELMTQYEELRARLGELSAAIVEGEEFSTMTHVNPELEALQKERLALVEERKRLEEEIASYEEGTSEPALTDEERAQIEQRNAELEEEIARVQEQLNAMTSRVNELTEGVTADLRAQMSELLERRNEFDVQIKTLRSYLRRNPNRVISELDQKIEGLNAERQAVQEELASMQPASNNEQIAEIDTQIAGKRQELQRAARARTTARENGNDQEEAIANSEFSRLTREIAELEQRRNAIPEVVDNSQRRAELEAQIAERRQEAQRVGNIIRDGESNPNYVYAIDDQRRINDEIRTLEAELAGLSVETVDPKRAEITARLESLDREIASTTEIREILDRDDYKDVLQERIDALKEQKNEEVTKPLRTLSSQIRTAQKNEINRLLAERTAVLSAYAKQNGIDDLTTIEEQLAELRKEEFKPLDPSVIILDSGLRRSDEDIIREELAKRGLSEEEINTTIGEYTLQPYEDAHDDGYDAPISSRQLVRRDPKIAILEHVQALQAEIQELTDLQSIYKRSGKKKELTDRIAAAKAELKQNKERLDKDEKGQKDPEEINAKKSRIAEINVRITEIDVEIEKFPGVVTKKGEKLDVKEEAHRIGDHIFKTAAIRRELAARHLTRDDYLVAYQAGLVGTQKQLNELLEQRRKINEEIKQVIADPEGGEVSLHSQIKEAEKEGNEEALPGLYEKLRQNLIKVGREDQLKAIGIDHEITSPEDVQKMQAYYTRYENAATKAYDTIKDLGRELRENAEIFSNEIKKIELEKASIELVGDSVESYKEKAEKRKATRRKLLEASMTPEKDLTDEQVELLDSWQEASDRFLSKKTTKEYTYTDKDGKQQTITVDSIDDTYPEYAQDVEFLGVPAYKMNLEQVSAFNQTHDPYVFGPEVAKTYEALEAEREGAGQALLETIMRDKQKYVESFNGIPNPHRVKYETWKTAGSTLKGMKPVSRDLPAPTRARNAVENVGRFLGIRVPKFTRLDEHGNKVRDIRGGLATLAIDAAVVGAVTASAVVAGPALALSGYAAKGIVTGANRVRANIEYSRHKDEIDGNYPEINQATRDAREVARKEYYRENGDNRFVSWAKAKADKYFTRKREKETEKAIVEKRATEYEQAEDERTEKVIKNYNKAVENQVTRTANQERGAFSQQTYNDINRDPDAVDIERASSVIAQNTLLESHQKGRGTRDVNATSTVKRSKTPQYVKDDGEYDQTQDLDKSALKNVDAPTSAITAEQIYTGRKQHTDRSNAIAKFFVALGMSTAIKAYQTDGFFKTRTEHHDAEYDTQTVEHDAEYVHHDAVTEDITTEEYNLDGVTMGDAMKASEGTEITVYRSVSGGNKGGVSYTIKGNDTMTGMWADDGSKYGTGVIDSNGFSAPVATDRTASASIMDANGVMDQTAEVKSLIQEALGVDSLDGIELNDELLSTLATQINDKTGWAYMSDLLAPFKETVTKTVVLQEAYDELVRDAYTETIDVLVTPAWDEVITEFAPELLKGAVTKGAIVGAAVVAADEAHEAVQTTYINGMTPGTPKETMPEAESTFDDIADRLYEEIINERTERQEQEEAELRRQEEKEERKRAKKEAKEEKKRAKKEDSDRGHDDDDEERE